MVGKQKRTFRTHIILVTEGRLILFLVLLFLLVMVILPMSILKDLENPILVVIQVVFGLGLAFLCFAVVFPFLWPKCFGKLIVTDRAITWRCLFMKSRRIELSDIRYSDIKAFTEGNVVKYDFYNTGFLYMLISKKSIPKIRVDKYHCTEDLIIFPLNQKLCEYLAETLPEPTNLIFQARLPAFRKADRQKERRKAKKKEKREKKKEKREKKKNKPFD